MYVCNTQKSPEDIKKIKQITVIFGRIQKQRAQNIILTVFCFKVLSQHGATNEYFFFFFL